MTYIRNRFEIQNEIEEEALNIKKLPNYFMSDDEISNLQGFSLSILTHILFVVLMFAFNVLVFSKIPKPAMPQRDLVFELVQNNQNQKPINKPKIASNNNSRAGGKHDPKRPVSDPGRASKTKQQTKTQPTQVQQEKQIKKEQPKPIKNILQPQKQPIQKQVATQPTKQVQKVQAPQKPSLVSAPTANKPSLKPAIKSGAPTPSQPKIATAPKSPFVVSTPHSYSPVGSTYRPQTSSVGGSQGATGSGSGAPAPKFSSTSTKGSGAGSSNGTSNKGSNGSSYASRGSGGGNGSGSNPGAGNPNGAPGVDSLRQVNWGPYMRDLEQRIKRNWTPPKADSSKRVVILFTIAKDGRLLSKSVIKSSGVPLTDQAALRAIEATAPFRPLPPEYAKSSIPVQFTFDYNVVNSVIK